MKRFNKVQFLTNLMLEDEIEKKKNFKKKGKKEVSNQVISSNL